MKFPGAPFEQPCCIMSSMPTRYTEAAFWEKVRVSDLNACWEWVGCCNSTGYGTLVYQGASCTAHRTAAFLVGLVDNVMAPKNRKGWGFILHECDNPKCCNPVHMRVGTFSENQADAYARGRRAPFRGHTHANSRLLPGDAEKIRGLHAGGMSQEKIGRMYGVHQGTVSKIILGKTHVL
jgi:hypothetical protein